ncbi:MAG: MBL fold metallo-hydrolase, partial [Comamonas sp.]
MAAAAGVSGCAQVPATGSSQGFLRQKIGKAQVVAVSDGVGRRPLAEGFVRNAPLAQVQAALAAQGLPTDSIDVPYTCFVLEVDGKRYLLDTGFADNGPAGTGQLHTNLRAAGIDPATIDAVLLSHLHGDHINGLRRKDGSLV